MTATERLALYAALQQLPARMKVRRLARNPDHSAHIPLLSVAAGRRVHWTLPDWEALLARLDACDDTVADWLSLQA